MTDEKVHVDDERGRLRQAIGDPGSFTPRRPGESVTTWSARAAEIVFEQVIPRVKADALRDLAADLPTLTIAGISAADWLHKRANELHLPPAEETR